MVIPSPRSRARLCTCTMAAGTAKRRCLRDGDFPGVPAPAATDWPPPGRLDRAPSDMERLAVENGVGYGPVGCLEDPPEGRPGDIHFGCGLFLLIAQEVGQAQRLQLIEGEDGDFQEASRDPLWLEGRDLRRCADISLFVRTGHMQIMNVCS
jgi:hypothetical protein